MILRGNIPLLKISSHLNFPGGLKNWKLLIVYEERGYREGAEGCEPFDFIF